jgi:glycolate oxidase FAD binding subunit
MRGDGMIAERAEPRTMQELADALRAYDESRTPIAIEGGGTLRELGESARAAATISMRKFNKLAAHEFEDLTCSAGAGMTLAGFAAKLGEHGQFVPVDAPQRRKATIGGTLAAGWPGPRRHLYGRARDLAIGSQAVLADGTPVNAGGMVVKNVSGYDMTKLYAGSFGTLAVLTRLNFKTLPLPQAARVLIAPLPERSRERAIAQIRNAAVTPAVAYCIEGYRKSIDGEDAVDGRMYLLLEGTRTLLERATRDIRSALGRAGVPETQIHDTGVEQSFDRLLDAPLANVGERSITYRSMGLPESASGRAIQMRDAANRRELYTDVVLDVMNGDVFVRVSERDARAFAVKIEPCDDDVRAIDPQSIIVAGAAEIRTSLRGWGEPPPAIEKMRALKRRFDPNAILNRGRFVGGI